MKDLILAREYVYSTRPKLQAFEYIDAQIIHLNNLAGICGTITNEEYGAIVPTLPAWLLMFIPHNNLQIEPILTMENADVIIRGLAVTDLKFFVKD